jgi:F0F1-type ATP synthase epsilon subunit
MALSVEIVTPRGVAFQRRGLSKVVLRRKEESFEQGSEVVVLPHHGEMMVRLPESDIDLVDERRTVHVHVVGGFAEVHDDDITVLTASAEVGESVVVPCAE